MSWTASRKKVKFKGFYLQKTPQASGCVTQSKRKQLNYITVVLIVLLLTEMKKMQKYAGKLTFTFI